MTGGLPGVQKPSPSNGSFQSWISRDQLSYTIGGTIPTHMPLSDIQAPRWPGDLARPHDIRRP